MPSKSEYGERALDREGIGEERRLGTRMLVFLTDEYRISESAVRFCRANGGERVTLTNGSGTAFNNTKLQLVAGDLNRVRQQLEKRLEMADAMVPPAAAAQIAQEAFSDYHLYTLGRRTTINNNETKQVAMLTGTGVHTLKRYVVNGQAYCYRNVQHPGAPLKDVVQLFYQFKNEQKAGLGMPMPAGTIRVYRADSKDGVHIVGEDRINHTPKDETININIGNAFDVVCERKQIDFRKISTNVYEFEYAITLRNHKSSAVSVEVNEPIGGTWEMLRSSHEWRKTDAWASQFVVRSRRMRPAY
jgi:hypothetical protein